MDVAVRDRIYVSSRTLQPKIGLFANEEESIYGRSTFEFRGCRRQSAGTKDWAAIRTAFQPAYGPFTSPQPHFGIGACSSTEAPDCELITASREPHSR